MLAALALLAYANSFRAGWHFDDTINITENRFVRITSLEPASLLGAMVQQRRQHRPFSNLTFALNFYLNRERVFGYHLVNFALHLGASLLIFSLLRTAFRRAGLAPERRDLAALAAAAVWTVHPLQVQAVTYIVQRQTVMASLLTLATLWAYVAGREAPSRGARVGFYFLAGLAFFLALGSKETALVTPALLLLIELYFFRDFSLAFLRGRPLARNLILAVFGALLILADQFGVWQQITTGYEHRSYTLVERLLTEPRVLFQYLGLIALPLPSALSLEHSPPLSWSLWSPWTTLPAILGWTAILAAAVRFARRSPLLSFAALWYFLGLLLESSFLPIELMTEHRLYLPSLAVIAPLAAGPILYWPRLRGAVIGIGLVTLLLLLGTVSRNRVWQTELRLWSDAARKSPALARPWVGRGTSLWSQGDNPRAILNYNRALRLNPTYLEAVQDRGTSYAEMGELSPAIADFTRAISLSPDFYKAYFNRGTCYNRQGQLDSALSDFNRAIKLYPSFAEAYVNRGIAFAEQGQAERALADFSRALELKPESREAYYNRGNLYHEQGQNDLAIQDLSRAIALNPNDAEAYSARGSLLRELGQTQAAARDESKARELSRQSKPPGLDPAQ